MYSQSLPITHPHRITYHEAVTKDNKMMFLNVLMQGHDNGQGQFAITSKRP